MSLAKHTDYYYYCVQANPRAYVLLNGDDSRRRAVVEYVKERGLHVVGSGPSQRHAPNGTLYNWYIQVRTQENTKPHWDLIHNALADFSMPVVSESTSEVLRDQLAAMAERLAVQRQERESAERRVQEAQASSFEHRQAETLYRSENDRLSAKILELADTVQSLQQTVSEKEQFIASFSSDFEQMEQTVRVLNAQNQALRAENEQLIFHSDDPQESSISYDESISEHLSLLLLEGIFGHVEFLKQSRDRLTEMGNPASVIHILNHVFIKRQPYPSEKKFHSAGDWVEVRFSDGHDESGRLYYTRCTDGRYKVLISRKEDQDKDAVYMKKVQVA